MIAYDIVVFSEVFEDKMRAFLIKDMKKTFPYYTNVLAHNKENSEGCKCLCLNGGVIIFSKYPIVEEDQKQYYKTVCQSFFDSERTHEKSQACRGPDCFSQKGVVYAQVVKSGFKYHVFGSHAQASYKSKEKYQGPREKQFNILNAFINQKVINKNEPVIIAGDLNVDKLSTPAEFDNMLRLLNSVQPTYKLGPNYTINPIEVCLAEEAPEYLDYILFRKDHKLPSHSTIETKLIRCEKPYRKKRTFCDALSDHFPVVCQSRFD